MILQTNTDPENRNIGPGFKGLTATSRKLSRMVVVPCQAFAKYFMKLYSTVFPALLLTGTDSLEHIKKKP